LISDGGLKCVGSDHHAARKLITLVYSSIIIDEIDIYRAINQSMEVWMIEFSRRMSQRMQIIIGMKICMTHRIVVRKLQRTDHSPMIQQPLVASYIGVILLNRAGVNYTCDVLEEDQKLDLLW
jgi:hypothetical protein